MIPGGPPARTPARYSERDLDRYADETGMYRGNRDEIRAKLQQEYEMSDWLRTPVRVREVRVVTPSSPDPATIVAEIVRDLFKGKMMTVSTATTTGWRAKSWRAASYVGLESMPDGAIEITMSERREDLGGAAMLLGGVAAAAAMIGFVNRSHSVLSIVVLSVAGPTVALAVMALTWRAFSVLHRWRVRRIVDRIARALTALSLLAVLRAATARSSSSCCLGPQRARHSMIAGACVDPVVSRFVSSFEQSA